MNITEINEEIRIEDFLASEGFYPDKTKKAGKDLWYCSPLRSENTPSFKVNTEKNIWFDYGTQRGGSVFELCKQMKNMSAKEAIFFLNEKYTGTVSTAKERQEHAKRMKEIKDNGGEIIEEINPIQHPKLLEYLQFRKIDIEIALKYLTEVHYMHNGKNYYALGFRCDNAGYELRNYINKRNINGKNVSTIDNGSNCVKLFEGFFDFLSYASEHKDKYKDYDYIVLNTSAFAEGMYNDLNEKKVNNLFLKLSKYDRIDTYFDNDETGKRITKLFQEIFQGSNDFSPLYQTYNDYNEFAIKGRFESKFTPDESAIVVQEIQRNQCIEEDDKRKFLKI